MAASRIRMRKMETQKTGMQKTRTQKSRMCKMRMRRTAAFLLTLCVLGIFCIPQASAAQSGSTASSVEISTVEDFLSFAADCSLDTWSQGKTFVLTADLDLAGRSFDPIPTFGGTFLGNGYTISGVNITAAGSNMGLFRFVQKGAVIRDLHVSGRVVPGGSAVNVGGIAGSSAGFIQNCSFKGTVEGETNVGGIAGQNREAGEIAVCRTEGTVAGENATGGITGRNLGLLLKCENTAAINASSPDEAGAPGSALDQISSLNTEEEAEAVLNSHTDTGGIAGYSAGIIQGCANAGTVGYSHVGYNVGGAVGRQAGYMAGCSNSGQVYGRKDVGGVVGQAEPDIILNTDGDKLSRLRQKLNELNTTIDEALDHTDASRADISQKLTAISDTVGNAKDYSKTLLDRMDEFTDGNLESLNTLTAAVSAALDNIVPALDRLSDVSADLDDAGQALSRGLDMLADSGLLAGDVLVDAEDAVADLRTANSALADAVRKMRAAADALQEAVLIHDQQAVKEANRQLSASVKDLGTALQGISTALSTLENTLNGVFHGDQTAIQALRDLGTAVGDAGTAVGDIGTALGTISDNTEISWETVQTALNTAGDGFDRLADASGRMNDAMSHLEEALSDANPLTDALGSSAGQFADAASIGSDAAWQLKLAFQILRDAANQLARDGDVSFTPLGQETRDAGAGLYASLNDMSDGFTDLQTSVDDAGETLSADLRTVSGQITEILNLMLDVVDSAQSVETPEDIFGDVSEEDIEETRMGKLSGGMNTGTVEGDRNVGGIAGAVAVEYSLDPEDDYSQFTFGSTYELKAVLQKCINEGAVTGKRDCTGGIAGRMDLGTANSCQSYGTVTGSGAYVGGIAGYADAAIRQSWAKCTLSGTEYVGGIAGWGSRMTGCRAITTILDGTEHIGSVAGDADLENGGIGDNWFLDIGPAGIDGVSYTGIAEPVSFDELSVLETVPEEFLSFAITLMADGEEIARIPFQFGDDLSRVELPQVPVKEGYYGTWPEFDSAEVHSNLTLEAVYTPWVTLAASEEMDGKLALALAEGQFTEEASLRVLPDEAVPPEGAGEADVWKVTVSGTDLSDDAEIPIRLLNRKGERASVWQLKDGLWQKAETAVNGSYLCLTMTGTSGVFCVCPASGGYLILIIVAASVLLIFLAIILLRRKKKRK